MPYYLKWPADTGTPEGNNKLCQLSGIATTGNVNIALTFAENVVDPVTTLAKGAYLYDGRRTLNSTAGGSGGYLLESNSVVEQANTSNWKLNGVATDHRRWRTALADDVYSFDSGSQADGVISIGARFNQIENLPLLALKSITITDSNGTHIVDMSASNGSTNSFTSTDGVVTLTLFGFTGSSHWVFYGSGGATYSGGAATSYTIDTVGGGLALRLGGAVTTYTIDTVGGGTRTTSSGAATSYALDSTGGGTRTTSAGAVTTYTIGTVGGGDVIKGATTYPGGAAVTFAADSTGGGVVIRGGGALLNFTAETTGGATRTTTGGGAVTVSLITVGGGDVLGPGYKPTITAPAVAVRRTFTGQGVRVVKTYRAPYTVKTQKTFRGPTCRL